MGPNEREICGPLSMLDVVGAPISYAHPQAHRLRRPRKEVWEKRRNRERGS